jgi:ABC-type branched-subunit amino acid transport system ATPase component
MQRLVEVARGIATSATYLLLDEPMAGLSTAEGNRLETALRACKRLGIAIVIIEHNIPFVMRIAEHVTVLQNGHVLADGSPSEIAGDRRVAEVFLGRAALV